MSQSCRNNASLAPRRPHVLVIGGAYGGLSTIVNLLNLSKGNKQLLSPIQPPELGIDYDPQPLITLLDERDGIFHTMGSPLAHTSATFATEAWLPFASIKLLSRGGVNVLQGRALHTNMSSKIAFYLDAKTGSQRQIPYDYLIVATGTQRGFPIVPSALGKRQFLYDVGGLVGELERCERVVVVGGGAVGVEWAAEIKRRFPTKHVVLVHSRDQLLSSEPLPTEFKAKALELLTKAGVQVILNQRLVSEARFATTGDSIVASLSDGEEIICGKVINTTFKHQAQTEFLPRDVVDDNGFVRVRSTLQFAHPHPSSLSHFAIGDIAAWTGIKRAGNAFIMGQFTATNILKMIMYPQAQPKSVPTGPDVDTRSLLLQALSKIATPTPSPNALGCPISTSSGEMRDLGEEGRKDEVDLVDCPNMEPMMALSIGDNAVVYQPGRGVQWGEELKKCVVGRGLGIDVCSEYLCLKDEACFL